MNALLLGMASLLLDLSERAMLRGRTATATRLQDAANLLIDEAMPSQPRRDDVG